MSSINNVYVPSTGPLTAKIMVVGEAPGETEEAQGEPFVGKAGSFLQRYLGRAKVPWNEVYRTNLSKYRPKGNKFELLRGTPELEAGLEELSSEISKIQPNLILACGRWPMFYLTGCTAQKGVPGTGITSWRGSIVEGSGTFVEAAEGRKVLITYHPSFIIRPQGFGDHPIFFFDLQKAKRESASPEFKHPHYDEFIDPPNLGEVAEEMMKSEWLTVDIETFGESLACVGFADSTERGLCITHECEDGWRVAKAMLESPQKKIFQFGAFDINYLEWHYGWKTRGYAFDTYIAAANLLPEFKRGLDFLTSIYTDMPFYKEERKVWKETGDKMTLWRYNIKDVIATHWIAMEQIKELEELYGPLNPL